jgi:hypothetical protein
LQPLAGLVADAQNLDVLLIGGLDHPARQRPPGQFGRCAPGRRIPTA